MSYTTDVTLKRYSSIFEQKHCDEFRLMIRRECGTPAEQILSATYAQQILQVAFLYHGPNGSSYVKKLQGCMEYQSHGLPTTDLMSHNS